LAERRAVRAEQKSATCDAAPSGRSVGRSGPWSAKGSPEPRRPPSALCLLPSAFNSAWSGSVSRILFPSPDEDHSSVTRVAAVIEQPTRKLLAETGGSIASLFGLAPQGVCHAVATHVGRGALLPHRFTLTAGRLRGRVGGLFSVALSVASPRLVVNQPAAQLEFGLSSIPCLRPGPRSSDPLHACPRTGPPRESFPAVAAFLTGVRREAAERGLDARRPTVSRRRHSRHYVEERKREAAADRPLSAPAAEGLGEMRLDSRKSIALNCCCFGT